jgi:HEAT repeat protein
MTTLLIIVGFLVLLVVSVAVAYLFYHQTISVAYLKSQGKVNEIIAIFQNKQGDSRRRREALTALVELNTPESLETLVTSLVSRQDPLHKQLLMDLPRAGVSLYPYLQQTFRRPQSRQDVAQILNSMGADSARALYPFLNDPDPALRDDSVRALDLIGWKPSNDAIGAVYWIQKKQPQRCAAIGPAAVSPLVSALKNTELCEEIIETLGAIGDPAAGWPLLNLGRNSQYTLPVIKAIAKWDKAGLPVTLEALKSPDAKIRQIALNALELSDWVPAGDEAGARYWIAKNRFDKCIELGEAALPPLLEALGDEDIEVCKAAAQALGTLGQEAAIDNLLQALDHPSNEVRLSVVEALGHFHTPRTIKGLVDLLGVKELYPANVAALAAVGQPAFDQIIPALRSTDIKTRQRAAEALERSGWTPDHGFPGAAYWIARQDWAKCLEAGEIAVDLLIQELEYPTTCANAAIALAQIKNQRAIGPIISALPDKPASVQRAMIEALGVFGAASVGPLLDALQAGKIDLIPVIQALGIIGDERAARPLAGFLNEAYPWSVREAAARSLGHIGLPALDPLFEALRGQGIDPHSAGIALGEAGKTARGRLVDALHSKEYDAQILVYALGKISDEESATAILKAMQSGQYGQEIRNTAQAALLEIGVPAIRPLINTLGRIPQDQPFLSSILVQMGSPAVEPLTYLLKNIYDPMRIEAVVGVLGEIGDARAVDALVDVLKLKNVNSKTVNASLDKIWKRQRREKGQQH